MVDALHEAHAAVRRGGALIDVRPDSARPPRVFRGRTERGGLYERRDAIRQNHAADRAVAGVVRDGLLKLVRSGHFWYDIPYADLNALDQLIVGSRRIGGYTRGTRSALAREAGRPIVVRRTLAYGIYKRR